MVGRRERGLFCEVRKKMVEACPVKRDGKEENTRGRKEEGEESRKKERRVEEEGTF